MNLKTGSKRVAWLSILYFLSSSSLLVLNKVAITAIPNASLLLFIQITSTVIFTAVPALVGKTRVTFKPKDAVIRAYFTVALVFLATIYSNFRVIDSVGVNPFIVLRCSTPLMVSVLDWAFMGRDLPDKKSFIALMGVFTGGATYAHLKLHSTGVTTTSLGHTAGFVWSVCWLVFFLLDMIYIKHVVETYPCSSSERTLYQNALALPVLLIFLTTGFEKNNLPRPSDVNFDTYSAVLLTCIAGAALSYAGMSLRSELSATAFAILGISCKMASALLNELFVEPEQDMWHVGCVGAVIICSSLYRQAPVRLPGPSSV